MQKSCYIYGFLAQVLPFNFHKLEQKKGHFHIGF